MDSQRRTPLPAPRAGVLRERLRQAEDTLRAIQHGEVDAFIVASGSGRRVVALEGTEHPYIALMERINEGAVTLSPDGEILYCNRFLAGFLGRPRERVLGSRFRDLVVSERREAFDALLAGALETGDHGASALLASDGGRRQVLLSLSPLAPAFKPVSPAERTGIIGIVTDLSELKEVESRLEARVRQQATIAELGHRALAAIGIDALLEEAVGLVAHTLGAPQCGITELLADGASMQVRAAFGGPADRRHAVYPHNDNSPAWLAVLSGAPVVVNDYATDSRFAGLAPPEGWGVVSAIAVLVPGDAGIFGTLAAISPEPRRFSDDDTHFLQSAANVLGAAIVRRRSEDLRRWLLEELTRSRDDERRRLARELHDETRQSLWAVLVGLGALQTEDEAGIARASAHRLHAIVSRTLDDVGRLARGLHPGALDDHGLVAAATQHLADFQVSYGIAVEHGVGEFADGRLPADVEIALYRILQEAMTNVARHAQARSVRVTLRRLPAAVELTVADDGIGFRAGQPSVGRQRPGGLGLHGMRQRALMLGGELTIGPAPVQGTTVMARIPLAAAS